MLLEYFKSDNSDKIFALQAGVDEVARGPLFGNVYAAAVILSPQVPLHPWLNDSKKVTRKRRKVVKEWIEANSLSWAVASVSNHFIDKYNVRNASLIAMELAIRKLHTTPELLLVDGNYFHGTDNFGKFDLALESEGVNFQPISNKAHIPHITVVGGDAKYASISAASILAKEYHDDYIKDLVSQNPMLSDRYELQKNMGYGTKSHIAGLKKYGETEHHRKSFLKRILPHAFQTLEKKRILYPDD
ncbi:ribonuclease H-like domain-containing protein [Blyttiomyces helicus]|uniref:Ribonuclease n=1 Tax=Blyttiomyces helicus TaxID=388810 RepID=A0A4P9W2K8_9FUNG|nr:ribonuclease H-like domain-containing protein [Blyttiomyces helicus]|eukprot:RKO86489.1 ribonuclease H-like domain-containing protein [Blyttiomyces helicus]